MIAPANLSRITIPPLENGDLLSRAEFERRYTAMPALKKAELIEGIVYMASPLRFEPHAEPHADLMGWLWTYKIATPGVRLGDNPTVRLDVDNEPQPDAVLLIDAQRGGQTCLSDDGYIEGAPEFVAEISASTATIDLRDKKRVYRRNGVKEYLVWQVMNRRIDWFSLQEEEYISLLPDAEEIIRSRVFPGLWLAVSALIDGDMPSAISTLQAGLNSDAHQEFVQQLATSQNPVL
ncbi:Uma2 family endonuclease [Tychonema sp. LEGE 07199]|uniref:Uma2 family endonuclease n=1 Tax=unclassified Tychonema TaxID=2642144 RepID=UPI00187FA619|nr:MULTISPECIES: Uma2 family endonuclease [unclassified Tychonema]MBE9120593.1 Uma2 family endonuclease [Tychonema sp. LEGE 07199]MBE9131579.1 Uma2 family endonuclease [Tychonema sp. LEGE 07196]